MLQIEKVLLLPTSFFFSSLPHVFESSFCSQALVPFGPDVPASPRAGLAACLLQVPRLFAYCVFQKLTAT